MRKVRYIRPNGVKDRAGLIANISAAVSAIAALAAVIIAGHQAVSARDAPKAQALAAQQVSACGDAIRAASTNERELHIFLRTYSESATPIPREEIDKLAAAQEVLIDALSTGEVFFDLTDQHAFRRVRETSLNTALVAFARTQGSIAGFTPEVVDELMRTVDDAEQRLKTMCRAKLFPQQVVRGQSTG